MFTLFLATLLAQSPPPPAPRTARVEGQVVSSTTGDPLRKAIVELHSSAGNYTSTSDAQGKFLFEEVEPRTYTLHAERVGYISQKFLNHDAISTLKFIAGQKLTDLSIKLTPQGAIYGRIADEDGDPIRNSDIDLLRWSYQNGKRELRSIDNSGLNVNDDGTFVIGYLPPGRYYAKATHGIRRNAEPGRKDEPQDWYVPTYFPSAIDPSGAAPIDIAPGVEVRGVEIRLRKTRVFRIRGKTVVNLPGPVNNTILRLASQDSGAGQSKSTLADGTFEFVNVLPGNYILEAITTTVTTMTDRLTGDVTRMPPLTGRSNITVTSANVDGVALAINAGAEITGKFKSDDSKTPLPLDLQVRLDHLPLRIAVSDQYKPDGTFRIRGLAADDYRIRLVGVPDGTYVKLMRFGDQDITHKQLDLTTGASGPAGELEITLSPNAADLAGVVRNSTGDAIPDVTIQLTRDDDEAPIPTVSTDQNGGFHIRSLAPGDYRVFAWQDDGDGIIQDPDFRKRFGAQSSKITLNEKSHESIEAKLITKEAMDTEIIKLP